MLRIEKNLETEVIWIFLQGGALSYLYVSIFVVSRPISFWPGEQQAVLVPGKDMFTLLSPYYWPVAC